MKSVCKKNIFLWRLFYCFIILLMVAGLNSCGNESPYGYRALTSDNVEDTVWLKQTFPDFFTGNGKVDSSTISIRVSKKSVMKGFINSSDSSMGAFAELLHVFSGFRNSEHNPNGHIEYLFFDGDQKGVLSPAQDAGDYFRPALYSSIQNNLHHSFEVVARDVRSDSGCNKFIVLFSDGETSIREEKNLNTTESNDLKTAVKEMLQANPSLQIGLLSLVADFNGPYNYDLGNSMIINCKRYLYALCFFDKKFLPEFNRFCELNKRGSNFLFNPQFCPGSYKTEYLTDTIDGQPNKALENFYAAYPMAMSGQDILFIYRNDFYLKNIGLPAQMKLLVSRYSQTDSFHFGNAEVRDSFKIDPHSIISLKLKGVRSSAIYKADLLVDFNQEVDSLVAKAVLDQDINNNTIVEVTNISGSQILKTEGLRDMLLMITEALAESKKMPMLSNFIQLGKYK